MQKHFLSIVTCFLIFSPLFVRAADLSQETSPPEASTVALDSDANINDSSETLLPDPSNESVAIDPQPLVTTPTELSPQQPSPPSSEQSTLPLFPSSRACSPQHLKMLEDLRAETVRGASFEEISAKFGSVDFNCIPSDDTQVEGTFGSNDSLEFSPWPWWSTRFEQLDSCGYHPQRREFSCALRLKQNSGYGGTPPIFLPGSLEWVTLCAQMGDTMKLVNIGQVHVHDNPDLQFGPSWHYGVTLPDPPWLHTFPNIDGKTLKVQATLSWYTPILNCTSQPTWGNTINFQIKLDP